MLVAQRERLQEVVGLIDNISINPDIKVDYYIPEFLMTVDSRNETNEPYLQFTYEANGQHPQVQHMPLKESYLQKTPQDLVNFITFSLEQFTEEIDSTFYGAQ